MACGVAGRGTRSFLEGFRFVETLMLEFSYLEISFGSIKGPPSCILELWRVSILLNFILFPQAVSSFCSDPRLVLGNTSFGKIKLEQQDFDPTSIAYHYRGIGAFEDAASSSGEVIPSRETKVSATMN